MIFFFPLAWFLYKYSVDLPHPPSIAMEPGDDLGTVVGVSSRRWKSWMPMTPFPKRWTKMACGRMTSMQMINLPMKSQAGRHWHGVLRSKTLMV